MNIDVNGKVWFGTEGGITILNKSVTVLILSFIYNQRNGLFQYFDGVTQLIGI